MRKLQIIGIIICILLVAGLAIYEYPQLFPEGKQYVRKGRVTQKSTEETTQETLATSQETQVLNSTQEGTQLSSQENAAGASTQQKGTQESTHIGAQINQNKIEKKFSQAPYNMKFVQGLDASTNTKTSIAVSDKFTITTSGDSGSSLDSAWISVSLKGDRSNKDDALKTIGEFAVTIDQNIADNDMQLLKNMFDEVDTTPPALPQTAERDEDGLALSMYISDGSSGGGSSGGASQDESLTLKIEEPTPPPPDIQGKIEDIAFLSDSLNKNAANGGWEITGELINNGQYHITGVQVKATLFDSYNTVLDSQNGFIESPILEAGTESSFLIHIYFPPADFDHYELSIPPPG
jgi:hypothetical protein